MRQLEAPDVVGHDVHDALEAGHPPVDHQDRCPCLELALLERGGTQSEGVCPVSSWSVRKMALAADDQTADHSRRVVVQSFGVLGARQMARQLVRQARHKGSAAPLAGRCWSTSYNPAQQTPGRDSSALVQVDIGQKISKLFKIQVGKAGLGRTCRCVVRP